MPGSPPISTTPPGTRPPPSTRSNSLTPVEKRGTSDASISARRCTGALLASDWKRCAEGDSATVSTSVFHALHAGHCPCHLGDCPPHSVQVYIVFCLATR